MSRQLVTTLHELSIYLQNTNYQGLDKITNEEELHYLTELFRELAILIRKEVLLGYYAFNMRTINLLGICGYVVHSDKKNNIYIKLSRGTLRILNPLNISLDTHYQSGSEVMVT